MSFLNIFLKVLNDFKTYCMYRIELTACIGLNKLLVEIFGCYLFIDS